MTPPLSTNHRIFSLVVGRKDGIVENIEADQSYYKAEIPKGAKRSFDQHLENVAPCDDESGSYTSVNTGRMLHLDPDYGFVWDNKGDDIKPEEEIPPTGWSDTNGDD